MTSEEGSSLWLLEHLSIAVICLLIAAVTTGVVFAMSAVLMVVTSYFFFALLPLHLLIVSVMVYLHGRLGRQISRWLPSHARRTVSERYFSVITGTWSFVLFGVYAAASLWALGYFDH